VRVSGTAQNPGLKGNLDDLEDFTAAVLESIDENCRRLRAENWRARTSGRGLVNVAQKRREFLLVPTYFSLADEPSSVRR
jgi:hypothetical protein